MVATSTSTSINTSIQQLIDRQVEKGDQLGVQVSAYKDGEVIVDAVAGEMGPEDPRPVQLDTLFNCFSTTKGVAATAIHMLADRGKLDYQAPVTRYWPEFGQNGKDKITVEQALSHQGGVHAVPSPLTVEFVTEWQKGLDWIAGATPGWEPGTATGYHALTYGWIVGAIVQGADGRHIKDFIREEIAQPLGVENEMFCGIPDGVEDRLATLQTLMATPEELQVPPDHDFFKAMPQESEVNFDDIRVRKACLPAANGHFSARALARMYGALANKGEIDGVRLVSSERVSNMGTMVTDAPDRVLLGLPLRKGIGFMLGGPIGPMKSVNGPRLNAFGHSGAGGSTAFADPDVGLGIAVTINKMQNTLQAEGPTFEVCEAIREELGVNG
ncbi:MAG: serine hydrolase domain-containing protein [Dehalococcoidia bacterium]